MIDLLPPDSKATDRAVWQQIDRSVLAVERMAKLIPSLFDHQDKLCKADQLDATALGDFASALEASYRSFCAALQVVVPKFQLLSEPQAAEELIRHPLAEVLAAAQSPLANIRERCQTLTSLLPCLLPESDVAVDSLPYGSFLRWIREAAKQTAEKGTVARKPGRPRTPDDIKDIILKLARENSWRYTRILGELRKLGITKISRQTVKNILKEHGLDPGPERGKGTWDEFLTIHADTLWQCDFATKKMWTFRGFVDRYFLVFIHLGTRRCWISPCTAHPDSPWSCQQARNFLRHTEDLELAHRFVMRDNDAKYTPQFDAVFESSDAENKRNMPASPNLRAHVERFIQTLQLDCLDKFVVVSQGHLNVINREFQHWYNDERPHSARDFLPPGCESPPAPCDSIRLNEVVCEAHLGGELRTYTRRAA